MLREYVLLLLMAAVCLIHGASGECAHGKYAPWAASHTACLPAAAAATPHAMTDAVRQELLDGHNNRRATVSPPPIKMLKMSWDSELEMIAQRWADSCPGLNHDQGIDRFIPGRFYVGQNLYTSFGRSISEDWGQAMAGWWDEIADYNFGEGYYDQLNANNEKGIMIGHFTQMAWEYSYKLGCAAAKCNGWNLVVCNYGIGGNIGNFTSPYHYNPADLSESARGSQCGGSLSGGLCDCGDISCNLGLINTDTCTCDCDAVTARSWAAGDNCYLDCDDGGENSYCPNFSHLCGNPLFVNNCPQTCNVCPAGGGDPDATTGPSVTTPSPSPSPTPTTDATTSPEPAACASGWTAISAAGAATADLCLKLLPGKMDYATAKQSCEDEGAVLLPIKTKAEKNQLSGAIAKKRTVWVGLTRDDKDDAFTWEDGDDASWTDFKKKHPKSSKHCASVPLKPSGMGRWKSVACSSKKKAACVIAL